MRIVGLIGIQGRTNMDQKKPDFSNVVGGSSSTADSPVNAPPAAPRTYTVQKGDSLSKIAKQFYGSTSSWRKIYEANRERIKDPDVIQPGWTLTIPDEDDKKGGVA
jgi:nucleoid-associated protein YgaU